MRLDIRRDLEKQRRALISARALRHQQRKQPFELVAILQSAQARRVRRRHIHRDVIGERREPCKSDAVVGDAVGAVLVRADIDAENAVAARRAPAALAACSMPALLNPMRLMTARSSPSRNRRGRGFPLCGLRRDRAAFDKTEAELQHRVGYLGILVEAGRETDGIGEVAVPAR